MKLALENQTVTCARCDISSLGVVSVFVVVFVYCATHLQFFICIKPLFFITKLYCRVKNGNVVPAMIVCLMREAAWMGTALPEGPLRWTRSVDSDI